ncbi:RecQ-mediated genome instability protein 1 [Nakaseomyces bracarensis]|uniref:RecQ-mediated genome instability protein 1 n=1 Tax=Nakaseomyces bracarensis TaxID=273131 RepID=A0ABR4NPV6_9SACH
MSLADILPNDITKISYVGLTAARGTREETVFNALKNEPWLDSIDATEILDRKMVIVDRDMLFQVMMIENVSKSKLSQVDDMKTNLDPKNQRVDRLKTSNIPSKSYKVINEVNIDDGQDANTDMTNNFAAQKTVYKLAIQSRSGKIFFAINLKPINWASSALGAKIIIRKGAIFNRGMFLLNENDVMFLGGMIRSWNEDKDFKVMDYLENKAKEENDQMIALKESRKRKR